MRSSLLKEELLTIFKNKKILIPIIAVLFIPVLYAGMFLWAFWDPYAKLDQLPVAVVNNDIGAKLDGEKLKLGDDLVTNLKKSKEFDFQSVSKSKGIKQLKAQNYYMLIEIPKDFSKNATTLLDKNPQKLKLIYVPNESYNFLSAQIGGTAVYKIKTAVAEQVTKTYAETMFKKVTDLADGIKKASTGADKLSSGASDLKKGANELNSGVATLAQKTVEFNDGMGIANAGTDKLALGSQELYNGLATLAEKSVEFNQGVKQSSSGSNDLAQGASQLNAGLNEVNTKLPQLIDGTNQAYLGAEQLKQQLPSSIATQINEQLQGSVVQLNSGIDQFQSLLGTSISNQITGKMAAQTSAQIFQQVAATNELEQNLLKAGIPPQTVQDVMDPIINNQQQSLINSGIPAATVQQIMQQQITQDQLQQQLTSMLLPQISSELNPGLEQGFTQFKTQMNGQLLASTNGLEEKISSQTNPVFDQLISGIGTISENQKKLQQGVSQLTAGSAALNNGAASLSGGMTQLTAGSVQLTAGAGQLASGANQLNQGASGLKSGMTQLTNGAGALTSGAGQLADGSAQLKDGTSQLTDGAKELATKLNDGAKAAAKVHSNGKTYDMMAKPINLDTKRLNEVPNYGTGFTPYFLSLGLFVGALILSIVFPFREPAVAPTSGFNWFITKFAILASFGIIQALLADAVILAGLDLHVQSVSRFILFTIITSLTFVSLIQVLVSVFGDVGRFIAILILIFQLTTSAGTFPLELIPNFLQHFNAFLPMTYTVRGFKAVVSSGDFNVMWKNIMDLLIFVIIFISGTFAYFHAKFKHDYRKTTVGENMNKGETVLN